MKYLIFSDSHRNTEHMDAVINKEKCDVILHLGDVADDVAHLRRKFFYKTICAVSGNNDGFFKEDPTEIFLEDNGHRMMLCHGHKLSVKTTLERLIHAAKANKCDIAIFGHTHTTCNKTQDGILLVNPGSVGRNGTYAVLKISENDVSVEIKTVNSTEN